MLVFCYFKHGTILDIVFFSGGTKKFCEWSISSKINGSFVILLIAKQDKRNWIRNRLVRSCRRHKSIHSYREILRVYFWMHSLPLHQVLVKYEQRQFYPLSIKISLFTYKYCGYDENIFDQRLWFNIIFILIITSPLRPLEKHI